MKKGNEPDGQKKNRSDQTRRDRNWQMEEEKLVFLAEAKYAGSCCFKSVACLVKLFRAPRLERKKNVSPRRDC